MDSIIRLGFQQLLELLILVLIVSWVGSVFYTLINNLYFHALSEFPGPRLAAWTIYRKAWIECVLRRSWHEELETLHEKYGSVVRVGPNELHFDHPQAYHDIYNLKNRWDKEESFYHSFGEDMSAFGFLNYAESKERKDVLNKSFSPKAISQATRIVQDKVDALCNVFSRLGSRGQLADLSLAFRCLALDIITYYTFGDAVDAIEEPNFEAPLITAVDASRGVFLSLKYFPLLHRMMNNCPRSISRIISPSTSGLVDMQEIIETQVQMLLQNPEEELKLLPHRNTILHSLMNRKAYSTGTVPDARSLYEEVESLMFAATDTVGNTLMVGTYHMLESPYVMTNLKVELAKAIPDLLKSPDLRVLEKLPYLNACIKEALRMSSGVISGLPRVVRPGGAIIDGEEVPGGTIVSIGSTFVHYNSHIFVSPREFRPERWLQNPELDHWLVAFSRGPRKCLGINLAWVELCLAFATVFRRFDMSLDASSPETLVFRETFLPMYTGPHVTVALKAVPT